MAHDVFYKKDVGDYPPCFDTADEYQTYDRLLKASSRSYDGDYCVDCNKNTKKIMIKLNRCIHPETKFVTFWVEGEPEVRGVSINSVHWGRRGIKDQQPE